MITIKEEIKKSFLVIFITSFLEANTQLLSIPKVIITNEHSYNNNLLEVICRKGEGVNFRGESY